jgi:hypothetical protein
MAVQRNFEWYRYVDDNGRNWGIRASNTYGDTAAFGLAAFNAADPPFGPESRRHRVRKAVYRDPATFRTVTIPIGTAAAFAALPATLAVSIEGEADAVTYNLSSKIPEKLQIPSVSRNLADSA